MYVFLKYIYENNKTLVMQISNDEAKWIMVACMFSLTTCVTWF